jgi:hypothetical protein
LSLADFYASLEHAADVLGQGQRSVENTPAPVVKGFAGGPAALHKMLEIEKVAVVSHEMREVQRRGGTFHIHFRGFSSSMA